jgi:hypothetical protein
MGGAIPELEEAVHGAFPHRFRFATVTVTVEADGKRRLAVHMVTPPAFESGSAEPPR